MADQKVSDLPSLNGADVDAADLLYIIDASAGSAGSKKITVGQYQLAPVSGGTANGVVYLNVSKVATAGSGLVFDGSNLGIGTSSPGEKLAINQGNIYAVRTGGAKLRLADQNNEVSVESLPTGVVSDMVFKTSATTQMTLDSSGNLGLGVTPSAWGGSYKALENVAGFYGSFSTNVLLMGQNWSDSGAGSYLYKNTGFASYYSQANGQHRFYNAPSGTAGNAITFTQAMTLDASGRLGIGQTSPSQKLHVSGTAANTQVLVSETTGYGLFASANTGGNTYFGLDSSAGVVTGTAYATMVWRNEANPIVFGTTNTERARITSGGDLLVGTTSGSGERLRVTCTANNQATYIQNSNATASGVVGGIYVNYTGAAPNNTGFEFLRGEDTGAVRFGMRSNGGLANYSGNNVNLSDRREKTNFAPAKSYLDTICAIPVQTFNYIDQSEDDPGLTLGVVAQDVQAVAPELVMESNWGTADEPKQRLSIYQTDLQYALMKCIQEQQVLITDLRARVAALESA